MIDENLCRFDPWNFLATKVEKMSGEQLLKALDEELLAVLDAIKKEMSLDYPKSPADEDADFWRLYLRTVFEEASTLHVSKDLYQKS